MAVAQAAESALIDTARNAGCGILITDHNVREALRCVDRAYLMYEGRILREGLRIHCSAEQAAD
jgi:lipopolysaccharide export system ATP-binding protein